MLPFCQSLIMRCVQAKNVYFDYVRHEVRLLVVFSKNRRMSVSFARTVLWFCVRVSFAGICFSTNPKLDEKCVFSSKMFQDLKKIFENGQIFLSIFGK